MKSIIAIALFSFCATVTSMPALQAECHCMTNIGPKAEPSKLVHSSKTFGNSFEDDHPRFDSFTIDGALDCYRYCIDKFTKATDFKLSTVPRVPPGMTIPYGQVLCNILGWEDDGSQVHMVSTLMVPNSGGMLTGFEMYKEFDEKLTCKGGIFVH